MSLTDFQRGIKPVLTPLTSNVLSKKHPTFEEVVSDCYDDVYRFALSLTGKECDAVDLTQSAFLKFAKKGSALRDVKKAKHWLFSVLRNEFIDICRKNTRFPSEELDPGMQSEGQTAAAQSDGQAVLSCLAKLPLPFREALALYYLQGYTYQEISSLLKIPIGTVMSRLSRGKSQLRQQLKPSPYSHG